MVMTRSGPMPIVIRISHQSSSSGEHNLSYCQSLTTTLKKQRRRKTQNSGVVVKGDEESGQLDYFGVLKEVIELEYDAPRVGDRDPIVVLFRCTWFDVYNKRHGIKRDNYGVMINSKKFLNTDEPFALASQVRQVYYTKVHNEPGWKTCIYTTPRNFSNVLIIDDDECEEETMLDDLFMDDGLQNMVENDQGETELLARIDVPPTVVNTDSVIRVTENEVVSKRRSSKKKKKRNLMKRMMWWIHLLVYMILTMMSCCYDRV